MFITNYTISFDICSSLSIAQPEVSNVMKVEYCKSNNATDCSYASQYSQQIADNCWYLPCNRTDIMMLSTTNFATNCSDVCIQMLERMNITSSEYMACRIIETIPVATKGSEFYWDAYFTMIIVIILSSTAVLSLIIILVTIFVARRRKRDNMNIDAYVTR